MKGDGREDLRVRTKRFALGVIALVDRLPRGTSSQMMGRQLLRAGTSVGAHFREAHRAKSNADFISKVEGALQELEETCYWVELLVESGIVEAAVSSELEREADELLRVLVTIVRGVKERNSGSQTPS